MILTAAIALVVWMLLFVPALNEDRTKVVVRAETLYVPTGLSAEQIIWLARLMECESGIDAQAVNLVDLDNTASWGLLQFKPSTFSSFTVKYGLQGELMDGTTQVDIVSRWILNPGEVSWQQQFPGCVRKLGEPPSNVVSA